MRDRQIAAEVVNAGCPGKGTDYELKLFQTLGAGLKPEVTVLCFFANDFLDNARGNIMRCNLTVDCGSSPWFRPPVASRRRCLISPAIIG